jgi:hypothetical protein
LKVVDFDGKQYTWPPTGHVPFKDSTRPRSDLHLRARKLLTALFPAERILEEIPIPKIGLFIDLYVCGKNIAVECNGQQHYEFNSFFYASKFDWAKAVQNDAIKKEWCIINNIKHIELPYDESDEQWKERIGKA